MTPTSGVFGVIWSQNLKIFKPRQIIHQNEALGLVITKNWSMRSLDPKSGGIYGHLGSNTKIVKHRQIIYQNEALGPVVTKRWFSGSLGVIFKLRIIYQNKALGPVVTKELHFDI